MKQLITMMIILLLLWVSVGVVYSSDRESREVTMDEKTEHGPNGNVGTYKGRSEELNIDIVKTHQKISDTQGGFTGVLDNDDRFGQSVTGLGDLDGDGVTDIVVGAPDDDDGGTDRGAVWILFLNNDGTVKAHQKISDTQGGFTDTLDNEDYFGISVSNIGDLDGDGAEDLAVGAYLDDDGGSARGAVWLLFLNTDGTVKAHQKLSDTQGGFTGTLDDGDCFGHRVTDLGDLDGDGVEDLAVGAYGDDDDDDGGDRTGAVWLLFLNANGTVKAHQKISDIEGNFTGTLDELDFFGFSVTGLGDLDGDGVEDLAVGAFGDDDGGSARGAVWLLFLNTDGTVKSHQKISDTQGGFTGNLDDGDCFAGVTDIGDLDGDGTTDIAVGAWQDDDGGTERGAVWILSLNADGTVKGHQKISDTQGGFTGNLDNENFFGRSVSDIGDLDGDGITDIAVGGWQDDDGGPSRGAVWILFLNDKPSFGTIWNTPLTTGDVAVFSVNVTDVIGGVNEVRLNFAVNDGNYYNWSITNRTGKSWHIEITLPSHATSIKYFFWVSDTYGNGNKNDENTLGVVDNDIPVLVEERTTQIPTTGDPFTLLLDAGDNIGVHGVIARYKFDDNVERDKSMVLDTDGLWNLTITVPTEASILNYCFYIMDTAGNYLKATRPPKIVLDNDKPTYNGIGSVTPETGGILNISVAISDNVLVERLFIIF